MEDREEILAKLVAMGYERTEQVETLGQFAVRGDILDVFPINLAIPYVLNGLIPILTLCAAFPWRTKEPLKR